MAAITPGWGTVSEINYLNVLGNWANEVLKEAKRKNGKKITIDQKPPRDRKKCLLGYAEAIPLRVTWGAIKKDEVKKHLIETMKKEYGEDIEL